VPKFVNFKQGLLELFKSLAGVRLDVALSLKYFTLGENSTNTENLYRNSRVYSINLK